MTLVGFEVTSTRRTAEIPEAPRTGDGDDSYADDWDDIDWNNYSAGFDNGAAGIPLHGPDHGRPYLDGHRDGSDTRDRGFRSASLKTAGTEGLWDESLDHRTRCPQCDVKALDAKGECHHCGFHLVTAASLKTTAQQVGYYVVSRNGVPISGPYATRSDAAPNMIEQRGAAVMFIGPGDSAEWAALKAKQFPVGSNTVNGAKIASDVICNQSGCHNKATKVWDTPVKGSQVGFCDEHDMPSIEDRSRTPSWETEEDPWAGERHTAAGQSLLLDLACGECGKKFKRKVGPSAEPKCPGCGGYDVEPVFDRFPLHGSMQERYADSRRVASLRHFADDDEVGPEEDEWFKQPKGLTDQVDTGVAPTPELQDPNPIAGQDLIRQPQNFPGGSIAGRVPRNLAEAAAMYASGGACDYCGGLAVAPGGAECPACGGTGHGANNSNAYFDDPNFPEDYPEDELDKPWNDFPSAGEY